MTNDSVTGTGQTGQDAQTSKKPFFEIASLTENDVTTWHWCLWSANGRKMATNAEFYDSKKAVVAGIKNMLKMCGEVKLIVQAGEPIDV